MWDGKEETSSSFFHSQYPLIRLAAQHFYKKMCLKTNSHGKLIKRAKKYWNVFLGKSFVQI